MKPLAPRPRRSPRSLHTIDEELKTVTASIMKMLGELAE